MEVLIETLNGKIFKCATCDAIHVEYKNLNFNFKEEDFWKFAQYIQNLDGEEWTQRNKTSNFKRKIIIPVGSQVFNALLNTEELEEFKRLMNFQKGSVLFQQTIKAGGLEFTSHLN
ncbi:DUF6686 family protein [Draconibacterium sp. IB214405]|uniref:DUF6686 family protein n=1 Tax=Draconibacterium sp. IB214405 TaxID=3097352 RepID=UPI002A0C3012|nr:DUF6686 family protein [Draconibacterium sp. IB214405]MDX8338961.1 DUF6686 family protein [Draconibacterium sp. IB214405]